MKTNCLILLLFFLTPLFSKEITIRIPSTPTTKKETNLLRIISDKKKMGVIFLKPISESEQHSLYSQLSSNTYYSMMNISPHFKDQTISSITKSYTKKKNEIPENRYDSDIFLIITKELAQKQDVTNSYISLIVLLFQIDSGDTMLWRPGPCDKEDTSCTQIPSYNPSNMQFHSDWIKKEFFPKFTEVTVPIFGEDQNEILNKKLNETLLCLDKNACSVEYVYKQWTELETKFSLQSQSLIANIATYHFIRKDYDKALEYYQSSIKINGTNTDRIKTEINRIQKLKLN